MNKKSAPIIMFSQGNRLKTSFLLMFQICKHFLEAVEGNKYGWFWECPGGEKCHYRHALPPGYVLTKDRKKMEEQKVGILYSMYSMILLNFYSLWNVVCILCALYAVDCDLYTIDSVIFAVVCVLCSSG